MRGRRLLFVALLAGCPLAADPYRSPEAEPPPGATKDVIAQCLSCHLGETGQIDIVGIRALSALPPEWPYLFEDAFDLDDNGIAGRMRFVSGVDGPMQAKFGKTLAAARFEDFALIAGQAHQIDLTEPDILDRLKSEFEARSPAPSSVFDTPQAQDRFVARGCADCHVTRTFVFEGEELMPLSDFLLHETEEGPRRTAPLWGCPECINAPRHPWLQ